MSEWTTVTDLDAAFDQLVTAGRRCRATLGEAPFTLSGSSESQIVRHAATLSRPMPPELVRLYERVGGCTFATAPIDDCNVFLLPLEETRWIVNSEDALLKWHLPAGYPEWFGARYFEFGRGIFGDMLVYCADPPGRTPGSIIMIDHDFRGPENCAQQPEIIVFLADSLSQWIARWVTCGLEEYGYASGSPTELPPDLRAMLQADHVRLNPGVDPEK